MKEFCTLKNLFTGICTLLAGYLIGKAVYDFLVTKPTSTSHEVVNLDAKTFPYALICGDPAIDQKSAHKYGYDDPSAYWGGRNGSWYGSFIGWNGREGKDNSTEIRDQLLNVKAESGLLESDYYVLLDGSYGFNNQSDEFIMVTFPYGRCQLGVPDQFPNERKPYQGSYEDLQQGLAPLSGQSIPVPPPPRRPSVRLQGIQFERHI